MKQLKWLLPAAITTLLLDGFISYSNRTGNQPDTNWLRFLLILFVLTMIFYVHDTHDQAHPAYLKSLFIGTGSDHRSYYPDYLRVLAVILVISVHTIERTLTQIPEDSLLWDILTITVTLCLTCNLLYIMLSGALLLGGEDETLGSFYLKRFTKVAVPLFAYYLFYSAIHGGIQNLYPRQLPTLFSRMLAGAPEGAPHFWLIYVILSLYIMTPFFRHMMRHLSERMLCSLIVLIFIFQAARTYLPLFQLSIGLETMLTSWEGVFIMGYFWTREESRRYELPMILLGIISAVITGWAVLFHPDYRSVLYNTAPTMMMMASAIFILFKRYSQILRRPNIIMAAINRYSYSIILIHWYILYYVVNDTFNVHDLPLYVVGDTILTIVCTLIGSYLFAWLYDNTIVLFFQTILKITQRLWNGFR